VNSPLNFPTRNPHSPFRILLWRAIHLRHHRAIWKIGAALYLGYFVRTFSHIVEVDITIFAIRAILRTFDAPSGTFDAKTGKSSAGLPSPLPPGRGCTLHGRTAPGCTLACRHHVGASSCASVRHNTAKADNAQFYTTARLTAVHVVLRTDERDEIRLEVSKPTPGARKRA